MDPDMKQLADELRSKFAEQDNIKGAVAQLEEQMKGLPATIENKLKAVRSVGWNDRGQYRGVFETEDDARCFGLFVASQVGGDRKAAEALQGEMKSVFERAHGGADTSTGGGLVPIEFARRVQRLVEQFGVFAANAFTMPMTTDQMTFQRRTKGLKVYRTGHNTAATASEMGFDTVNLNAVEWNALALYPKALNADAAGALGELVAMEIAQAFAFTTDHCGFVGDGTSDDLNVLGITTGLKSINGTDDGGGLVLAAGNLWSEITEDNFLKLISLLPQYQGIQPAFYVSNPFFWQVMAPIQMAKGGITRSDFAGGPTLQFLGYPVRISQVFPKTEANSQIPVIFGDLRLSSTHGSRQELTVEQSMDVKFIERQVAVLGTQRHAIANHSLGDAENAGPVVGLITADS